MNLEKARLENVDIIDVLQFIVDNNTSNYIADFEYDKMTLLNFKRESKNFLWMSRDNGTWIFPEDEVFFTGTAAFNTWTSYSVKNDSVKAFMVEVERVSDGRVYGNITELDYERHVDYLVSVAETPREVQLTFKDSMRNFSMQEYNNNSEAIRNRYGPVVERKFLPENEYFFLSKIWEARKEIMEDIAILDFDYYKFNYRDLQFIEYGYHAQDRAFVNSSEVESILKNGLNLYALSKDGTELKVTSLDEYNKLCGDNMLFCTTEEERAFLKHLDSKMPPLFSEDELDIIFESVLNMAKENRIENMIALNSVLYKLEHLTPQWQNEETLVDNQEIDIERE